MSRAETGIDIPVLGDMALSDDQSLRLVQMMYHMGHFDFKGGFVTRDRSIEQIKAVHFVQGRKDDIEYGDTDIDGIDGRTFASNPYLYLEAQSGRIFGWKACRPNITSHLQTGTLFQDASSQVWFSPNSSQGVPDHRVEVDIESCAFVRLDRGSIVEQLPLSGCFMLSTSDPSVLTDVEDMYPAPFLEMERIRRLQESLSSREEAPSP